MAGIDGASLGNDLHRNFMDTVDRSLTQKQNFRELEMKEGLYPYEKERAMLEALIAKQQYQDQATQSNWKRDLRNALARGM